MVNFSGSSVLQIHRNKEKPKAHDSHPSENPLAPMQSQDFTKDKLLSVETHTPTLAGTVRLKLKRHRTGARCVCRASSFNRYSSALLSSLLASFSAWSDPI
ncbi:hypothetical protein BaRGS_00007545 [Batillaria attramentaria]|uniref:Uncharacterized protein n=1 Tax=Batillaria attramentaria TaxID=370345 RepID=A0ABD0LPC4_9CAEN